MSDGTLDRELAAAIREMDPARVAKTYARAADLMEADGDVDGACFLLTQAMIFALEAGDPLAGKLRARLIAYGREIER